MTTHSHSPTTLVADLEVMIQRSVRHTLRTPDALVSALVLPVMITLAFTYVFGGALSMATDEPYLDYLVPGVMVLCVGFVAGGTAVSVQSDLDSGVIDRFRSLPTASITVLVGHVTASLVRTLLASVLVLGVAAAAGFRPDATPTEWLTAFAIVALYTLTIAWIATCVGLLVRSVDAANAFATMLIFVPYLSSAFVPPETMPTALQAFADHQPLTPIVESLRQLLTAQEGTAHVALAFAWLVPIMIGAMAVTPHLYRRRTTE
jgi:ABC-2 type transport system permease protein